MFKSPPRITFFSVLLFLKNIYLQDCLLTFVSPLGGLLDDIQDDGSRSPVTYIIIFRKIVSYLIIK